MNPVLSRLSWVNHEGSQFEIFGSAAAIQDARDVIIFGCGNTNVKMELQNEQTKTGGAKGSGRQGKDGHKQSGR